MVPWCHSDSQSRIYMVIVRHALPRSGLGHVLLQSLTKCRSLARGRWNACARLGGYATTGRLAPETTLLSNSSLVWPAFTPAPLADVSSAEAPEPLACYPRAFLHLRHRRTALGFTRHALKSGGPMRTAVSVSCCQSSLGMMPETEIPLPCSVSPGASASVAA